MSNLQQQVGQANQRINAEDTILSKLQNIRGVTPEESRYLSKLNDRETAFDSEFKKLVDAQEDISKNQLDMSGRILNILQLVVPVFAIGVTIVLFAGKYFIDNWMKKAETTIEKSQKSAHDELISSMKSAHDELTLSMKSAHDELTSSMKKKTQELDVAISKRLEDEYVLVLADACSQLAIPWWETYEEDYQLFLRGKVTSPDNFVRYISGAKALTERGKAALARLGKRYIKENQDALVVYAKLQIIGFTTQLPR